MAKILHIHNLNGLPTRPFDTLIDLQGDFKTYHATRALADRIAAVGFKYPAFIWEDGDTAYVLDAHSRVRALRLLQDDGWEIPPIPVIKIQADNLDAAKVELLHLNSRYGEMQAESAFWQEMLVTIPAPDLDTIVIPELTADDRPTVDLVRDDDLYDTPDAPADRAMFSLAIVLTAEQFTTWTAYKQRVGYATDSKAFLALLAQEA